MAREVRDTAPVMRDTAVRVRDIADGVWDTGEAANEIWQVVVLLLPQQ